MHLVERDARLLDLLQRLAAVQQLLMEPAPGAPPRTPWVYGQRIEHHRHAGQPAEGRLVLRADTRMLSTSSEQCASPLKGV